MTDYVHEHLATAPMREGMPVRGGLVLPGGGLLSIQASHFHYCSPRDDAGPYTSVEVMAIDCDDIPEEWSEYDDGGVYGWIPVALVNAYIASRMVRHG